MKNRQACFQNSHAPSVFFIHDSSWESIRSYLTSLLENLAYAEEHSKHHPESDALYHSLQVFECALKNTENPILWAAALLHDVGKAIDYPDHARVGAEQLEGLMHPQVCWLIRHHLDLLCSPKKTRQKLKGSPELQDLEKLRKWDLQGRKVDVEVMEISEALSILGVHSLLFNFG